MEPDQLQGRGIARAREETLDGAADTLPDRPQAARAAAASRNGIVCMVLGSALLTMNDAILKWLTAGYPVGELMFLRGLFVALPITLLAWRDGGVASLRLVRPVGTIFRALLVVASAFMFITGLRYLPLADAYAIAFAGPLFMTLLAMVFLGEKVGWRRWLAVIVGFLGVLVIIRPAGEGLGWVALLPLGAAVFGALRDVVTRRISAEESSTAILAVTTLAVTLAGLATWPFGWLMPTARDVALMALSGLLIGGAHFLLIEAVRLAELGLVAPFKYSALIWSVLLGFLIWGDLPDFWTWVGSAIVIASGLYILRREAFLRKPERSVPRPSPDPS